MHDAGLPSKDAARLSYVISNHILPEAGFAVNRFALRIVYTSRWEIAEGVNSE